MITSSLLVTEGRCRCGAMLAAISLVTSMAWAAMVSATRMVSRRGAGVLRVNGKTRVSSLFALISCDLSRYLLDKGTVVGSTVRRHINLPRICEPAGVARQLMSRLACYWQRHHLSNSWIWQTAHSRGPRYSISSQPVR